MWYIIDVGYIFGLYIANISIYIYGYAYMYELYSLDGAVPSFLLSLLLQYAWSTLGKRAF
jgi:hypothetical protein